MSSVQRNRRRSAPSAHGRRPLDARLGGTPRAPTAARDGEADASSSPPPRFFFAKYSFANPFAFAPTAKHHLRNVHLICSTDRPGGRDCLSLFALLASSTHSVYKYFEHRTLNLVRVGAS